VAEHTAHNIIVDSGWSVIDQPVSSLEKRKQGSLLVL